MLFDTHTEFTHFLWKQHLKPGMTALDATSGRGLDTLLLAQLLFPHPTSRLIAIDIQEKALNVTRKRLIDYKNIEFYQACHSDLSPYLKKDEAALIIYNLGYLPGGDRSITTMLETTKKSFESAKESLCAGGMISVTFYPGHQAGAYEAEELIPYLFSWDSNIWRTSRHTFSPKATSPLVVLAQKK